MDTEIKPRLSSRTHLAETCRDCGGEGYLFAGQASACDTCGGSGRVVRFTHDPRSDNQSDDTDAEIDRLHSRYRGLYGLWSRVARAMTPAGGPDITDEEVAARAGALLDAARKAHDALEALNPPREGYAHRLVGSEQRAALSALSAVLGDGPPTTATQMSNQEEANAEGVSSRTEAAQQGRAPLGERHVHRVGADGGGGNLSGSVGPGSRRAVAQEQAGGGDLAERHQRQADLALAERVREAAAKAALEAFSVDSARSGWVGLRAVSEACARQVKALDLEQLLRGQE